MASVVLIDTDSHRAKRIDSVDYPLVSVTPIERTVLINEVLPFRVRFTTIGIPATGLQVPGIGLQVIGINNYIL